MELNIVDRPAVTVVGLQIRAVPMSPDIPALWQRFVARIGEIARSLEDRVTYGVMQMPAGTARSATDVPVSQLDYMAAVAVADAAALPAGMSALVLPAGRYARFSYPFSRLGEGFDEIFNRLLPASAFVQRPGPYFERYGGDFSPDRPDSPVEIWLPVAHGA
ncbi:MAG TPA: GyrI-like domain-containing protein [Roseateles sp.]